MSLPISTNRVLAAAQRVARADMLSTQDAIVAGYQRGMCQTQTRRIAAVGAGFKAWTVNAAGLYLAATGAAQDATIGLDLPVGVVVEQLQVRCWRGGGVNVSFGIFHSTFISPGATPDIVGAGGGAGAWATASVVATAPGFTVKSGARYYVKLTSGQSGDRVVWCKVLWHRP